MHDPYLMALHALADPFRANSLREYHKVDRVYLGLTNPQLNDLTKQWRDEVDLANRITIADGLWRTNIFEARIAAAKMLTQARMRDSDEEAWQLIATWYRDFDSWAIADHACTAGQKRLLADPSRIERVESWTRSEHMWTRRAALVITLPWTKMNNPKPEDLEIRERVLGWAGDYTSDPQWFIQKAIAGWLSDLGKHDPERVRSFIDAHGDAMKPFARKEAVRLLK
ncbi:DNA alkylation repair protein [Sulfitobacter guttiformis]|uniref:3-methyladenine DNA glycosylase AlkD n=1 Tax=Sulfitobacter guttiformis TaxID=74349 RepID=A0A420DNE6_9RHOB|nr:DNA alkylation repair protein [Sulfitobacter guttiformis]KIN73020.1 DNA alkylation repair enzyme superfamily protein [Sulfitobacter guttiformis KCTC 32187]RKE95707.1 3-methyladenine DNA glycosylase AlkD [Sulfitobacter guttiformis]